MFEKITPANWLMFAMHNYDNRQCEGEEEFQEDIKEDIRLLPMNILPIKDMHGG